MIKPATVTWIFRFQMWIVQEWMKSWDLCCRSCNVLDKTAFISPVFIGICYRASASLKPKVSFLFFCVYQVQCRNWFDSEVLPGPPCQLCGCCFVFYIFPSVFSLNFTAPDGSPFTHLFINLKCDTCEFWAVLWCFTIIIPYILILYFSFRTSSIPRIRVPGSLWSVSLVSSYSVC